MTGSSIDAEDTWLLRPLRSRRRQALSFNSRQQIRPTIEAVPLAPKAYGAAEAYGRMMRNEARSRIVLLTGL